MNRVVSAAVRAIRAVPRTRGDEPFDEEFSTAIGSRSPHTRG